MAQLINVLLTNDKEQTVHQSTLDCELGLGELNQIMGPTVPLPLLKLSVERKATSSPDVQIIISLLS